MEYEASLKELALLSLKRRKRERSSSCAMRHSRCGRITTEEEGILSPSSSPAEQNARRAAPPEALSLHSGFEILPDSHNLPICWWTVAFCNTFLRPLRGEKQ